MSDDPETREQKRKNLILTNESSKPTETLSVQDSTSSSSSAPLITYRAVIDEFVASKQFEYSRSGRQEAFSWFFHYRIPCHRVRLYRQFRQSDTTWELESRPVLDQASSSPRYGFAFPQLHEQASESLVPLQEDQMPVFKSKTGQSGRVTAWFKIEHSTILCSLCNAKVREFHLLMTHDPFDLFICGSCINARCFQCLACKSRLKLDELSTSPCFDLCFRCRELAPPLFRFQSLVGFALGTGDLEILSSHQVSRYERHCFSGCSIQRSTNCVGYAHWSLQTSQTGMAVRMYALKKQSNNSTVNDAMMLESNLVNRFTVCSHCLNKISVTCSDCKELVPFIQVPPGLQSNNSFMFRCHNCASVYLHNHPEVQQQIENNNYHDKDARFDLDDFVSKM